MVISFYPASAGFFYLQKTTKLIAKFTIIQLIIITYSKLLLQNQSKQ